MNKVLIVAGERQTGERFQKALGQEGYQTAVVWNPIQMVEFCRQHAPDIMIVDLDLAELGLWSAVQAVRGIGTLANIPFIGLASTANAQLFEKARTAGFVSVFPTHESARPVIELIQTRLTGAEEADDDNDDNIVSRDPSLNRLRDLTRDIIETTRELKPRVSEYGEDGPELFGYIENAGVEIRKKLNTVPDFSLHDKELRHDFRNMIGSVTGFAELIMMESGLSSESINGLTNLRHCSKEFVEILDDQKAEANA